jgi:mono/diheme cytochrome c family protein
MLSFKSILLCLSVMAVIAIAAGGAFIYSGQYPMGADVPHNRLTYWLLETMRERSIARAASGIKIPDDLNTSERLLAGGADYNDMCAGCHLQPGKTESDFTLGLYPAPPDLTQTADGHNQNHTTDEKSYNSGIDRQFWIIKHGIKASGMPAWGPTHDDQRIWNMVAFLQRLPDLSAAQYQILTARGNPSAEQGH